jgi:xanthine dehydrogenase YagS FAD-binding subunit
MENFTLAAPQTIEAALAGAQEPDAKFIAGGTDLLQLMKDFVERPKRLVDLDGLPFDRFSLGNDGARIGALVRMSDLADDPTFRRHYPVVAEALLASASAQVRNMATIGGNLLQLFPRCRLCRLQQATARLGLRRDPGREPAARDPRRQRSLRRDPCLRSRRRAHRA